MTLAGVTVDSQMCKEDREISLTALLAWCDEMAWSALCFTASVVNKKESSVQYRTATDLLCSDCLHTNDRRLTKSRGVNHPTPDVVMPLCVSQKDRGMITAR
nr:hypothetical protein CFP56_56002 [Quercus suber]